MSLNYDPSPLYECGCCGAYHPINWHGDCREDANRYPSPEEYAKEKGVSVYDVEVVPMEDDPE